MADYKEDYFNQLYEQLFDKISSYVIARCNDLKQVEDIVQEVFWEIYKVIENKGVNYIKNPEAFCKRIAKFKLIKYYSFKATIKNQIDKFKDNSNLEQDFLIENHSIQNKFVNNLIVDEIWQIILKKPITTQKIFALYYSSGEAVAVKNIVLEGSCCAELFYNPKAFLFDDANKIFGFAYENWQYNEDYYYGSMQQGLSVFSFDINAVTDEDKLIYNGTLSNIHQINPNEESYYNYYLSFVERGVTIGNYVYTISNNYIKSYSLTDYQIVDSLDLSVLEA